VLNRAPTGHHRHTPWKRRRLDAERRVGEERSD
jgi:hypothetical protein